MGIPQIGGAPKQSQIYHDPYYKESRHRAPSIESWAGRPVMDSPSDLEV